MIPLRTTPMSESSNQTEDRGVNFYFSRNCPSYAFANKWLISGVIVASDLESAKSKLDRALAKSRDTSAAFDWIDLQSVDLDPSGIAAITMGGE